jgi:hypothetical protein
VFWSALLHRAFADLHALANGHPIPDGDGRRMSTAERASILAEVTSWFLTDNLPVAVSLEIVCDNLDIDPGWMRSRARQIINGAKANLRRHRLTLGERAVCIGMLAAGDSTAACARHFGVDVSTCRKVRLKAERAGVLKYKVRIRNAASLSASGVHA